MKVLFLGGEADRTRRAVPDHLTSPCLVPKIGPPARIGYGPETEPKTLQIEAYELQRIAVGMGPTGDMIPVYVLAGANDQVLSYYLQTYLREGDRDPLD